MDDAGVQWSELPPELWSKVGKYLRSHIDAVRFRSVCRSWRSSVPPFPQTSPPLRLRFPSTTTAANRRRSPVKAFLSESTVYRLAPLGDEPNPNRSGRLVKLEKSELGKMRYLHPLSNRIRNFGCFPKQPMDLNLLDLRIGQVARSYALKLRDDVYVLGIDKLVVFPEPIDADNVRDCIAIAVWEKGKLGFARSGDKKWSLIDEQNHHYDDVIVYNRQIYAVDRCGTVFWIDSSMRLLQFSPPLIGFGHRKHLVECGGELLVVDRFLEEERPVGRAINVEGAGPVGRAINVDGAGPVGQAINVEGAGPVGRPINVDGAGPVGREINVDVARPVINVEGARPVGRAVNVDRARLILGRRNNSTRKAVGFQAYRLDQEWGRWVEVKNLGNRSIVLGNDGCFSVDGRDFEGCVGNCIYFSDFNNNNNERSARCCSRVFDLGGARIGNILGYHREVIDIFCQPPTWLSNFFQP